jgi:hypothetical protein
LEDKVPPHWPSYIGEKRENFWAKHRGSKCGAIRNILGNTLGTWRTPWELHGNTPPQKNSFMESQLPIVQVKCKQWTVHSSHQTQLEKKPLPLKEQKWRHLGFMTQLLIGCMEILFIKLAATTIPYPL